MQNQYPLGQQTPFSLYTSSFERQGDISGARWHFWGSHSHLKQTTDLFYFRKSDFNQDAELFHCSQTLQQSNDPLVYVLSQGPGHPVNHPEMRHKLLNKFNAHIVKVKLHSGSNLLQTGVQSRG